MSALQEQEQILDRNHDGEITPADFDGAVLEELYGMVCGFTRHGEGADTVLEMDYRRKTYSNNLPHQVDVFRSMGNLFLLITVVMVCLHGYNAVLVPLFDEHVWYWEALRGNDAKFWIIDRYEDVQLLILAGILAVAFCVIAGWLDTHEAQSSKILFSSKQRSDCTQFLLAVLYSFLISAVFRVMLVFAEKLVLTSVKEEDMLRTYGNACWLIALLNLQTLQHMVVAGGLVYAPAAVTCCGLTLMLIAVHRVTEDGEMEGNDLVFLGGCLAAMKSVFESIKEKDRRDRSDYLVHGSGRFLRRYVVQGEAQASRLSVWHALHGFDLEDRSGSQRRVTIKITSDVALFDRLLSLHNDRTFDSKYVLPLLRGHVSEGDERVAVLPCCPKTVASAIAHEGFAGLDLHKIVTVAQQVAEGIAHIHDQGLVHGRLMPRKIRWYKGRFVITDLSYASDQGSPLQCGMNTEAYAPPEILAHLSRGCLHKQPVMATQSIDVWAFGMILYHLLTGYSLLTHNASTERLKSSEKDALMSWKEPSPGKLAVVLSEAEVSPVRRLLAQDLVATCLQGHPADRFQSMKTVLAHPFFSDIEPDLQVQRLPHLGKLDVIFSYQSTQEGLLRRLRRCLNELGISTCDGTQVQYPCSRLSCPAFTLFTCVRFHLGVTGESSTSTSWSRLQSLCPS